MLLATSGRGLGCCSVYFRAQDSPATQCTQSRDFPGGPAVKNLPPSAGYAGLIPGQGEKNQQSPCVTTREIPTFGN